MRSAVAKVKGSRCGQDKQTDVSLKQGTHFCGCGQ